MCPSVGMGLLLLLRLLLPGSGECLIFSRPQIWGNRSVVKNDLAWQCYQMRGYRCDTALSADLRSPKLDCRNFLRYKKGGQIWHRGCRKFPTGPTPPKLVRLDRSKSGVCWKLSTPPNRGAKAPCPRTGAGFTVRFMGHLWPQFWPLRRFTAISAISQNIVYNPLNVSFY